MQVLKAKKTTYDLCKDRSRKNVLYLSLQFFSTQQRFIPMLKSVYNRVNILKEIGIIIPLEIAL